MTSLQASGPDGEMHWGPERTSILAIIALVFALPCFIPGTGIIASLLAVFALVGINSSKGRVGGSGLAAAALILGLFSTAIWTAVGYGGVQTYKWVIREMINPAAEIVQTVEKDDIVKLRSRFTAASAEKITPEAVAAFRTAIHDNLGAFQNLTEGVMGLMNDYKASEQQLQELQQNQQNLVPVPLHFEKGIALVVMYLDSNNHARGKGGSTIQLPLRNAAIVLPDRTTIFLIDPQELVGSKVTSGKKPGAAPKPKQDAPEDDPEIEKPATSAPQPPKPSTAPGGSIRSPS